MAKNKQKPKQANKERRIQPTGYVMKSVPSWIFTIVNHAMGARKISKKLRAAVYPMLVFPPDFWVDASDSKIFINEKNMRRSDAYNRFSNNDINNRYKRLGEDNYKHISLELSKFFSLKIGGTPKLVPFLVPSKVITGRIIDVESRKELVLAAVKPKSVRSEAEFHFLDEVDGSLSHCYKTKYRESLYPVIAMVDGVNSIIYSKKKNFKINRVYDFVVSGWHQMKQDGMTTSDVPIYYSWLDNQVLESYSDIYDIIGKMDSYKMLYPNWLYDDETNDVILSSLLYMEKDVPCFNLLIFGSTRTGKSRALDVISKIFKEKVNSGSSQTVKGLIGSFTEVSNIGAMMASRYVFLCDEYFRTGIGDGNKGLDAQHIDYVMSKTLEMLEHSDKTAQSGNFSRRIFFDKSFIGTNNIRDLSAFHKAFLNDPASFVRYSFLSLSKDETDRFDKVYLAPSDYTRHYLANINKAGFNWDTLAKTFRLLRQHLKWVKVTNEIFSNALKKLDYVDNKYKTTEKLSAMLRVRTLMNYAKNNPKPFPLNHSIKPTDDDIEEAIRFTNRLIGGFKSVCGIP